MKKNAICLFTYDRNENLIEKSTICRETYVKPDAFFQSEEATNFFSGVKNFDWKRMDETLEAMTEDKLVKAFGSENEDEFFVVTVKRRKNGKYLVMAERKPLKKEFAASPKVRITAVLIILSILLFGGTLAMIVRADLYKNKNDEARDTVIMVANQTEKVVSSKFDAWFKEVKLASTMLGSYRELNGNEEEIESVLKTIADTVSFEKCGVLLETGDLFFSESQIYNISHETIAKTLIFDGRESIDIIDMGRSEYIILGVPFESPSKTNDGGIAAICGFAKIEAVSELLSVQAFDGKAIVSLIKSNGFRVAVGASDADTAKAFPNLFDIIKTGASKDVYDEFESNYLNGSEGTLRIAQDGSDYYVFYSGITFDDSVMRMTDSWHLVIFVSEIVILGNANRFLVGVMAAVVGILLFASVLTAALVLSYIRMKNADLLLNRNMMKAEVLSVTAEKERDANLAKTRFFANMSHDMRTPLSGIVGESAIAQKHLDDPEILKDCFSKIDSASEHLLSLINNVLDISRIESKKLEIVRESMNVGALSDECRYMVDGQLASRGLKFVYDKTSADDLNVYGDKLHLRQIVINLLGNAIKFTPDGGEIDFTVKEKSRDDGKVIVEFVVKDTGVGMSEEFMKKMFRPFEQERGGARSTVVGSGLGLSISKQLAELMGGTITAESVKDKGTTMRAIIPFELRTEEETAAERSAAVNEEESEAETAKLLFGKRILLVDDNALNREIAETLLSDAGLKVECAFDGKEAYDKFVEKEVGYYDVILMDVMMPVMDGIESTKAIRASGKADAEKIAIIAMTANTFEDDIRRAKEAGMNEQLSKPIKIDAVLKTISKYVS